MVATARPGGDDAYLRDLGARDTVDVTGDVPAVVVALRAGNIHAVVYAAGDGLELADLLVPGSRSDATRRLSDDQLDGRAVQATPVRALPASRTLGRLAAVRCSASSPSRSRGPTRWSRGPTRWPMSPCGARLFDRAWPVGLDY